MRALLRAVTIALLAIAALLTGAAAANAAGFTPGPDQVVVRSGFDGRGSLTFYFPSAASDEEVRRRTSDAISAARLRAGELQLRRVREGRTYRVVRVRATLGERRGFAERSISAESLDAVSIFPGQTHLRLPGGSRIRQGQLAATGGNLLTRQFRVTGTDDLVYALPTALVWSFLVFVTGLVAPYALLRRYALAVERRSAPLADRVHALRRMKLTVLMAFPLFLVVTRVSSWRYVPEALVGEVLSPVPLAVALPVEVGGTLFPLVALVVAASTAIGPVERRLRSVTEKPSQRTRRAGFAVALVLLPLVLGVLLFGPVGDLLAFPGRGLVSLGVLLLALLTINPVLVLRMLGARPLDPAVRARLLAVTSEHGLAVTDVMTFPGRGQRVANALLVGALPFRRYILVSDYLLDELQPDEVEAVVAHEIGHAKGHHLLAKMGAGLILYALTVASLVAGIALLDGTARWVVVVGVALVLPLAPLVVQGVLGVRLEHRADSYAAKTVGPEPLARGLERLAEVNHIKRRTGPIWNALTQHPGIEQRVARLRAGAGR